MEPQILASTTAKQIAELLQERFYVASQNSVDGMNLIPEREIAKTVLEAVYGPVKGSWE